MAWHEGETITQHINGISITIQMTNRFLTDNCEDGKHEECSKSSLIGLCGCPCHDGPNGES